MKPFTHPLSFSPRTIPSGKQGGFTLVELMVGVVLSLLTMLVITQVTVQAEGRKRTVSMGSDAQVNGSLALYAMQRDIQMAGYGAATNQDALGCPVNGQYDAGSASFSFTLAPVIITDGTNGAPDTITVLQAHTRNVSLPIKVMEDHTQTGNYFVVNSSIGVSAGDLMIAVPLTQTASTSCALLKVVADGASANTTLSASRIPHVSGGAIKWNVSSIFPASGYVTGSYLVNMGALVQRAYSVNSSLNLVTQERNATDGSLTTNELYPQIVNIQAMYGKDTNADGVVDLYDNTTPATNAQWQQVLTIRVAVVARSNQYEKEIATATAPVWDVGAAATVSDNTIADCRGGSKCITLKVDQLSDWQHYRYKVYETIVPLRNVLWHS